MQNMDQSAWHYEILYVDISSEDEQLLTAILLCVGGGIRTWQELNLKFTSCFMQMANEPLHLTKVVQ
jgi:hypothetical protein